MDHLLRRLARHAAAAAAAAKSAPEQGPPDMIPLPTPSVPYFAAAAAGQPDAVSEPTVAAAAVGGGAGSADASAQGGGNLLNLLNSTFSENYTLFTDGPRDHMNVSSTPHGHVTTGEAWPVSSFAVIKALVLIVILVILLVVSCKVVMQYVIKSTKREKQ